MTVRVALAVLLTVALVGATLPAVDAARVERSETQVRAEVDALVSEARALAEGSDATPADVAPARRTVALDLPAEGFGSAPLRSLRIDAPTVADARAGETEPAQISWRVGGGGEHARRVAGVRLLLASDGPLTLRGGGERRLSLSLVAVDGGRAVVVRAFKYGNGTTPAHGDTARSPAVD